MKYDKMLSNQLDNLTRNKFISILNIHNVIIPVLFILIQTSFSNTYKEINATVFLDINENVYNGINNYKENNAINFLKLGFKFGDTFYFLGKLEHIHEVWNQGGISDKYQMMSKRSILVNPSGGIQYILWDTFGKDINLGFKGGIIHGHDNIGVTIGVTISDDLIFQFRNSQIKIGCEYYHFLEDYDITEDSGEEIVYQFARKEGYTIKYRTSYFYIFKTITLGFTLKYGNSKLDHYKYNGGGESTDLGQSNISLFGFGMIIKKPLKSLNPFKILRHK